MGTNENDFDNLAYSFFKAFLRFEFALKKCGFLRKTNEGAIAEAGWDKFVGVYQDNYTPTDAAKSLIKLHPKKQRIGENLTLYFSETNFGDGCTELCKLTGLLKVARNNLFHGGKSNEEGWDGSEGSIDILNSSIVVLAELAQFADKYGAGGFNNFFTGIY